MGLGSVFRRGVGKVPGTVPVSGECVPCRRVAVVDSAGVPVVPGCLVRKLDDMTVEVAGVSATVARNGGVTVVVDFVGSPARCHQVTVGQLNHGVVRVVGLTVVTECPDTGDQDGVQPV